MKQILSTFLLFTFFSSLFSQQRKIDSLLTLSAKANHDSIKLNYYEKICELCELKDNLKYGHITDSLATKLVSLAKNETEKLKFIRKKLYAYNIIQFYYAEKKQLDSLDAYIIKCLEIAKSSNDQILINDQLNGIAEKYKRDNQFSKAMDLYLNELKKAEKSANKDQIIFSLSGIAETYSSMRNNKKALEYELKKLQIIRENVIDSLELFWEYLNVGHKYYDLFEEDNAVKYYLLAYENLKNKNIYETQKMFLLFKIGRSYNELRKTYLARNYFMKGLEITKNIQDSTIKGILNSEIGQTYFYEKNYKKALEFKLQGISLINKRSDGNAFLPFLTTGEIYTELKQYKLAEKYLMQAKTIAEDTKHLHNQKVVSKVLSQIYLGMGDITLGNQYLVKYYQLKDSMDKLNNSEELLYKELNYEYDKKESQLKADQEKKDALSESEKKRNNIILYSVLGGLLLVIGFAIFVFKNLKITQKKNTIITEQKQEVEKQKQLVEEKQKEILDSITYAKRLQEAILPPNEFVNSNLANIFIYYQPKDIVAGDFYWAEKVNDLFFIAAADSTGHGVPGAMVSVVCSNALNRTIKEFKLTETGKILDKTRELVLETFEKSSKEVKDGMDISLLCIDKQNHKVFWSGANNPLWFVENGELKEIKADKQPIGKTDNPKPFTTHEIEFKENLTFYLFTDGLADQFGGPKGKKFKYKQFEEILISINDKTMQEQSEIINKQFEDWKGDLEQVDDVCVIGIKI